MAIDMMTYEFLKRYVEGANMGENARPRGIWKEKPDDGKGPYKEGDYVTHNNVVYIWCNINDSNVKNPQPGTDNTYWQQIAGINQIGDINAALDAILAIQESIVGGVEQ